MTLSNRSMCLNPNQGLSVPSSYYSIMVYVELMDRKNDKAHLYQIFAKSKTEPNRVNKSYNHDRDVHVCGGWMVREMNK